MDENKSDWVIVEYLPTKVPTIYMGHVTGQTYALGPNGCSMHPADARAAFKLRRHGKPIFALAASPETPAAVVAPAAPTSGDDADDIVQEEQTEAVPDAGTEAGTEVGTEVGTEAEATPTRRRRSSARGG